MTLRAALRTSSNRAAVQLLNEVGIPQAVGYAEKLNVGTPPSVPSLALGSSEVTLGALTAAYGAFANKGIVRTPVMIRRVEESDGKVLFENSGEARRAVSEATAFLMSSMLADVINAGTAYRARQAGFTLPAAGKTGTTNDYVDAWFVGFTPRVVTGVWVGFDQPRTIISNGYAGDVAVPIWASVMKAATRGAKAEWIERPSNVVGVNVCRISGKLPNQGCGDVDVVKDDGQIESRSMIYTEFFVRGTQPGDVCPLHRAPSFMQRLAGVFGGKGSAEVVSAAEIGVPLPPPTSTSGRTPRSGDDAELKTAERTDDRKAPEKAAQGEEPKKKRGFWSRLFGGGGDDEKKKEEEEKKKREEERKRNQRKPGGDGPP